MKVRIEGSGHCVEVEVGDDSATVSDLMQTTEEVWARTRVDQPRLTMGYAGQLTQTSSDRPVAGNGNYQRQVDPVTA